MAKKRKSLTMSLDEVDRTMYSSFCSAANSLSQLYTQSMNQQKLSFQAGEREGLEKLYQWILRLQEGGSRVTTVDILNYLQSELNNYGEEQSMSPRPPFQNPHSQPMPVANSGFPVSLGSTGVPSAGQGIRPDHYDQQPKNYVFSNALSSPVRRSLQNYHIAQGDYYANEGPTANGIKHDEPNFQVHNRDSNGYNSNDASMDMHAESPVHEAPY
ncbi:PREDICTED: uncharacterized protein LOC109170126 [Ipomoea nil]|uniref:uncharacterized protein LOC109170126 n=1 Tax=Ipomoea nil TaxID=35883 RepID=UPI000900D966|nr:PREDICTED: uncharacterized protein LOC109170126 [Ipomoea nil]